jgi:DNA integrity scanning protein DisA with diadenylate cyclase activity
VEIAKVEERVKMSLNIAETLKSGVSILRDTTSRIRTGVFGAKRGEENPKVLSLAARVVLLLEELARILESISQRASLTPSEIIQVAPYTYIFKVSNEEVVVTRTRPEHVVLSVNTTNRVVSIKTRKGLIEISPEFLRVKSRRVNVAINPADREQYRDKLNEVKNSLKIFEIILSRRLSFLPKLRG